MQKTLAARAVVLSLLVATSGCLHEVTLNAKGGGTMTVTYHVDNKAELQAAKRNLESSWVKVTSAELVGAGADSRGVFKLEFQDIARLYSAPYFKDLTVTRADGSKPGTKVLTGKIKHSQPSKLPDNVAERYGKEVKIAVTFPGEVVESNGKVSGGNTVTWTWGLQEFFDTPELTMTATYGEAGASGTPAPKAGG